MNIMLNMKKILQTAMLLALSVSAMAQFTIKASVFDGKTRAPLSGATLKISEKILG